MWIDKLILPYMYVPINLAVGLTVPSSYLQCLAPEFHHFSIQT